MKTFKITAAFVLFLAFGDAENNVTAGDALVNCLSDDNGRRIEGCSALIDDPSVDSGQRSFAYGMRALAYSLRGDFDKALTDFDEAIDLNPEYAVALNNRAWVYFKLGRGEEGVADVERALQLSPGSPYALDTRAHIRQGAGNADGALADYEGAMHNGGEGMVKQYQCGLRAQGLYFGMLDGIRSPAVSRALRTCASNRACDPLPEDEECKPSVS
jgi:tetratricopeptide (TPR) repeat protein